jgi:G:T-mismatch repair DNA endonuclease (very short patch repair protein)
MNSNTKGYHSKLETRIQGIFNEMGITYTTQFCLKIDKMRRFYDFLLNDIKLIIEVNGDYWHANPLLYKETDILNYKFGIKKAKDIWDRDQFKKEMAEKKGYTLIYIWETEIHDNKDNLLSFVIDKIKTSFNI